MAIYKLNRETKKETIEDRLQRAINLGREEALKEVLYWLEDATIDDADGCDCPIVSFTCCDNKEEMLQSFKERFNIADDCNQQYPSDFIND
jgi:hypothetical protein